jgi:hypothetical protein
MADIKVLNAVSGTVEGAVIINTKLANPTYRGPAGSPGPKGDRGDIGPAGKDGESGVYVGETEPTDDETLIWINPSGTASEGLASIQYVDAAIATIELMPGPAGPIGETGPKGEDGYTPIKGVDYFDGKDGANGKDGKDGYTPVKGVDYFDGRDGEPGKDGENGKDYVLTENDKVDIAELVLDLLPAAEEVEV